MKSGFLDVQLISFTERDPFKKSRKRKWGINFNTAQA
jgi:hypothetical protein